MSRYIKTFDTPAEYDAYSGSSEFISPNISYIKGSDKTMYDENEIRSYKEPSWIEVSEESGTTLKVISGYITNVTIPSGVTSISNYAFNGCSSLTSIDLPSGVTSIGASAFGSCNGLTGVTIPSGVTSIGASAFNGCLSLTSIDLPSGVTSISDYVFSSCLSLTSIDLPSGVTSIGTSAFNSCNGLTGVTIPSGVTSISNYAFQNCSRLTSVTVNATTPPTLGSYAFKGTNNCPIYVPSVEAYKTATNWSAYADRIQPIPTE